MCDRECVTENSNYNMEIKWYLGGNYPNKNSFMLFFFRVSSSFPSNNEFCQKLQPYKLDKNRGAQEDSLRE